MPKLLTRAESYFDNQEAARALEDVGFESWVRWLLQDRAFLTAISDPELLIHWEGPAEPMMLPAASAVNWRVPELLTHGDLARWLDVSPSELLWLGNLEVSWRDGLHCADADHGDPFSRHYRQTAHRKRFGEARIIEAPLPKLKQLQRRILEDMLAKIPCHDAAHGFVKGRSIRSFAAPHVGSPMVIRIDLRNFFVTIGRHQAAGVFRLAGYPPAVAHALSLLCTTRMSAEMFEELIGSHSQFSRAAGSPTLDQTRRLYTRPHLPQGAPTSPLLANLCAYRLDCRLAALAEKVGGIYTRYADDLAFSADLSPSQAKRFSWHVGAIVMDEGFEVHDRKTKRMRRGTRQRIAGVVVNRHPNVSRQQFDRLKAILHNCARRGPASQNRDGHTNFRAYLTGWVAHVAMLNPARGAKLQQLLQEIDWGEDA